MFEPAPNPGRIDVDAQCHPVVHGDGERLRAAHAAQAGGDGDRAGEGAAEPLGGDGGEAFVGALEDSLGTDVDPRTSCHLAVHGQFQMLQPTEFIPGGPVGYQVGVGDQHPRGPLMGAHHSDRLARLDQHGLVVGEGGESSRDGIERRPRAGGAAGAAVDHQIVGALGNLGVEVVVQHPQHCFLLPAAAADRCSAGRSYRSRSGQGHVAPRVSVGRAGTSSIIATDHRPPPFSAFSGSARPHP